MKARPALGDLKPHLTCRLCRRYLTEATTTSKCLHSFCYGCIATHLATSNSCPACNKLLHPKRPLSKIRRDRILQRLVYKAIPGLLKRPEGNESGKEFEQDSTEPLFSTSDYFSICLQQIRRRPETEDEMSIERNNSLFPLVSDNHEIEEPRYLFCAAIMTLKILKKFICFKFSLTSRYEIGMMCSDQLFDDDHSLIDVAYISKWTMNDPLKIQYLILDKEKFAKSSDESWEAADVCPSSAADPPLPAPAATSDDPRAAALSPLDDHPVTLEPSGEEDQTPRALAESVAGAEAAAVQVPGAVGGVDDGGNAGNKRLKRNVKSKKAFDSVAEKPVPGDQRFPVELKMDRSLSVGKLNNGAEKTQDVRKECPRSRRQKRRSDDVDVSVGGGVRPATGAKRLATCRASRRRHCDVIPGVKLSPDTTSRPSDVAVLSIQSEQLPPQNREEVDTKVADGRGLYATAAAPGAGRVAPIKISFDYAQFISPAQKTYQLQRKDELRVQLSRKPLSAAERSDSGRRSEVTPRKKRKSGSGKRSKNPTKTRRKAEGISSVPGQNAVVLNSFSLAPEKNGLRTLAMLPPHGLGLEAEDHVYHPRSPYSRKRRVPSITVTPSPVVFDTEISTYPYSKTYDDRKVASRSPRKRATAPSAGKLPKVVSISTIPPTFVLTSTVKQEHQSLEKVVGGKPASLKLYLKMTDDRKKTALQMNDAADDCFMVSSTVADEEEFPGSGSSAEMSPDSAVNVLRGGVGGGGGGGGGGRGGGGGGGGGGGVATAKTADQPSAPVVVNVGSSLEMVNPGSAYPIRIGASEESPGPLYGDPFSGTRAAAAAATWTLSSSSSSSGLPKDVGMKRRRLESVISSLKPVASVTVSTGHHQGVPQSPTATVPHAHGTTTASVGAAAAAATPAHAAVRRLGPSAPNPPRSLLSQLICHEPLNIPKLPTSNRGPRQQPLRTTGIFTPMQLNDAVYGLRANAGGLRTPSGQRQCRPRGAPRRPSLGPPRSRGGLAYPFDGAVRFPNQGGLVVPMLPHWQLSYRQAVKPCPTSSGTTVHIPQQLSEANGYDAPLELTTKRSRDAVV